MMALRNQSGARGGAGPGRLRRRAPAGLGRLRRRRRGEGGEETGGGDVSLQLAHSYTETQPQHRCGAQVIADEVAKADVGLTVEIFPASQLGGDADRIASVVSGDIDMDIQGASALGAVYEPVAVLDAAYAFDDSDHLAALLRQRRLRRPADRVRGRDRRAHAGRLVGRHAAVHRQRADPRAR